MDSGKCSLSFESVVSVDSIHTAHANDETAFENAKYLQLHHRNNGLIVSVCVTMNVSVRW